MFKRLCAIILVVSVLVTSTIPSAALAQVSSLPAPGSMLNKTPDFSPLLMQGVRIHPDNALMFDFIMDSGDSGLATDSAAFRQEAGKLVNYFLASLTIKEEDLWVNLSPFEHNRILSPDLEKTELGRDMLAQDYILKQLSASLIYPEENLGETFWNRVSTPVPAKNLAPQTYRSTPSTKYGSKQTRPGLSNTTEPPMWPEHT